MSITDPFKQMPDEINLKVTRYLSPLDVVKYQSSCKHLKKIINLNLLHNASPNTRISSLNEIGNYETGDEKKQWMVLSPFLFSNYIHTVKLSFKYMDQGWGNRKGVIYIKEIGNNQESFIAQSPVAQHEETICKLSFQPRNGCTYILFYKVGGGGGHQLFVDDIKLQSYIYCAAVPLANKLLPVMKDGFFLDMIKTNLEIVAGFSDIDQYERLVSLFNSVGIDLKNKIHIEHIKILFHEFEMISGSSR